jgi:hypothetical protein
LDKNNLLLRINAEQLLNRVLRYHRLVNLNAPEIIRASELKMILQSLCKAVDVTSDKSTDSRDGSHKDYIDRQLVKKWSNYVDNFFEGATEETIEALRYDVNSQLSSRSVELSEFVEMEKEYEELEVLHSEANVTTLDQHKSKKQMQEIFEELGLPYKD